MSAPTRASWVAGRKATPRARLRLFCFPHGGGGAATFRGWAAELPETVEVCPLQLPGREMRYKERPFVAMGALVEALEDGLQNLLEMPFAFFGHSLGALVSFELARRLRDRGKTAPVYLFVAGHAAPQMPRTQEPIRDLPDADFVERIRRLQGIADSVWSNKELMDIVLPVLRADYEIVETYRHTPGDPLDIPITAFGGEDDPVATPSEIEPWREQTRGPFALEIFPGGHFFVQTARGPLLQTIGRTLAALS